MLPIKYICYSINKENKKSFIFFGIFFHKSKLWIVWNWFIAKLFQSRQNVCFEAIQNGGISDWVLQVWTEVCQLIFAGWEVQTMWNLQNNVWRERRRLFKSNDLYKWTSYGFSTPSLCRKTVEGVESHWFSGKEKVLSAAVC